MKKLTHDKKLDYLVGELCDEFVQKQGMHIEKDDRRTVMRTLMNIRIPRTISEEFLQVQDEFLREEAEEKGIVRLEDIPTISEQYGSDNSYSDKISIWQGDITRLAVDAIVKGQLTESLKEALRSCYNSCMKKALENGIRSIAFCCISTGEFHFPNDEAAKIAVKEVNNILNDYSDKIDRVIFNVFKDIDFESYEGLLVKD